MKRSITISVLLLVFTAIVLCYILLTPETLLRTNISDCSPFSLAASQADLITDNNEIHISSVSETVDNEKAALNLLGEYGFPKNEMVYDGCFENQYITTYCFSQYFGAIPVIGGSAKVITDTKGNVVEITSNYTDVADVNTVPAISEEKATTIVSDSGIGVGIVSCRLAIYTDNLCPVLSYEVITDSDEVFIIDALDGTVICTDEIYSLAAIQTNGQLAQVSVNVSDSPENSSYVFEDKQKKISLHVANDDLEDHGFDMDKPFSAEYDRAAESCPKSAADAYYNINRIYDFYADELRHISTDGNGNAHIYVIDNLGKIRDNGETKYFLNNAKSSSLTIDDEKKTFIFVGKSTTGNTFSCNLDVMAHEYTHAVEYWTIGGSAFNNRQGEGINEGIADVLGECCQSYYDNCPIDWNQGGIRNLADPQGVFSIPDFNNYTDSIDEHESSALVSYAAYLMSKGIYKGTVSSPSSLKYSSIYAINDCKLISKLWYNSLFFMTPSSDFTSFRYALERSADIMCKNGDLSDRQYKSVCAALEAVKIPVYKIGKNTQISVLDENSEPLNSYWLSIIDEGLWGITGGSEIVYNGIYENSTIDTSKLKPFHNYTVNVRGLLDSVSNIATLRFNYRMNGDSEFKFRTEYVFSPVNTSQGKLSGKVCKAADKVTPIPNAQIVVYLDDIAYETTETDNDGQYSLDLPEGEYRVEINADGFIGFSSNEVIVPDETVYSETYLMVNGDRSETGTAHGYVYNALSGTGVSEVKLDVYDNWNNTSSEIVKTIFTENDGSYRLELPLGNYTVKASSPECIDSTINIVVDKAEGIEQNIIISPYISDDTFRVVLTWGEDPRDLDSHMIGYLSNGSTFHTYYSDTNAHDGNITVCKLDHDDTNGNGHETITLVPTLSTPYTYYVYKYAGVGTIASSGAKVEVYQGSSEIPIASFNAPVDQGSGDYWNLFTIENNDISIINRITDHAPQIEGSVTDNEIMDFESETNTDDSFQPLIIENYPNSQYYADACIYPQMITPALDYRMGWNKTNFSIPVEVSKIIRKREDGSLIIPLLGSGMPDGVSDREIKVSGIECTVNGPFSFSMSDTYTEGKIISYFEPVQLNFNDNFVTSIELYLDTTFVPSEIKHEYSMNVKVQTNIGDITQNYKIIVRNMDLYYQSNTNSNETNDRDNTDREIDKNREYTKSKYMENQLDKVLKQIDDTSFSEDTVFSEYFINKDYYDVLMRTVVIWQGFMESDCAEEAYDYGQNNNVLKISNVRVKTGTGRNDKEVLADIYFSYEKYFDPDSLKRLFSVFKWNDKVLYDDVSNYSFNSINYRIDYKSYLYSDTDGVLELEASHGDINKTYQAIIEVFGDEYKEGFYDMIDDMCGEFVEELSKEEIFDELMRYSLKFLCEFKDIKDFGEDHQDYVNAKHILESISIE